VDRLLGWAYSLLAVLLKVPGFRHLLSPALRLVTIRTSPGVGAIESGVFYERSDAVVSRCQELGVAHVPPEPEEFPPVGWSVFDNAEVTNNRYFPYLLHGNTLMVGPRRLQGPYQVVMKRNRIIWSHGDTAIVNRLHGERMGVDEAIFIGGRDFTNWYHWLVDGLPALHLANSLPEHLRHLPVLIPAQIFKYPTMLEALELFLNHRDMIVVPEWAMVKAKKLVWIDPLELSNIPKTSAKTDKEPRIPLLHREGMEGYRDVYLNAFAGKRTAQNKKIVLARDTARRSYNQDDVLDVAAEFGFEPVYPEKLSLAEQVKVFRSASHILGPSGAGFAGLLFSQTGTKALCWQDTRLRFMTILPDLATLNHSDYQHLFYQSDENRGLFRSSYTLDTNELRKALSTWAN